MTNPKCEVCGHLSRVGAPSCEMCDASFGAARDFGEQGAGRRHRVAAGPGAATEGPDPPAAGAPPPDIPSPRFAGTGDVIWPTLEVYKTNFVFVVMLVVVTSLPLVGLQYLSSGLLLDQTGGGLLLLGTGGGLLSVVLGAACSALLSAALIYGLVRLLRTGASPPVGESLRWGLKKLPKVAAVNIPYTLMVLVGYMLLIVPGVIVSIVFALAVPVAVVEGRGVFESFGRSAELTKGYRGMIFLTYFLWGILIMAVNLVVSLSFSFGAGGGGNFLVSLAVQSLVGQLLQSTSVVLTLFIYLGILNESRGGFAHGRTTSAPGGPERGGGL